MQADLANLIAALPPEVDEAAAPPSMEGLLRELSRRPVPVGRLTRLWSLGSMQAKIALA